MRADNSDRLVRAARERSERTVARTVEALATFADRPVTVAGVAAAAGVSRSWIYTQPQLLEQIEALSIARAGERPVRPLASLRASASSLQRRLELAHQRVAQLTEENRRLRDELAGAYGSLRAARAAATTPGPREFEGRGD